MKAISPILSHTIFIALTIMVLALIASTIYLLYIESVKQAILAQLRLVSQQTADEITKLYSLKSSTITPDINKSVLIGKTELFLPTKVSGRKYSLELRSIADIWISDVVSEGNITAQQASASIIAKSYNPSLEYNYTIYNMEVELQGYSDGDRQPMNLEYHRLNINGAIRDKIILGNQSVLISFV